MTSMVKSFFACLLVFISGRVALSAPVPPPRKINAYTPQLFLLNPKRISEIQRRPWHPAELVAIVGDQRGHHWHYLRSLSHSPDGRQIAVLEGDYRGCFVRLWEKTNLHFLTSLPMQATFIRFLPQDNGLLTCSDDGIAWLWNITGSKPSYQKKARGAFGTFRHAVTAISSDGTRLISDTSSSVDLFDLSISPPKWTNLRILRKDLPRGESLSICSAALSTDGKILAELTCVIHDTFPGKWGGPFTYSDEKVTLWDISDPQPKKRCVLENCERQDGLAFSPDGKTLTIGGNIWDLSETKPKLRAAMNERGEKIQVCVFSSDSRYAITTSLKFERLHLRVRDMRQLVPRIIQTLPLAGPYSGVLALAPDGKSIAVGEMNTFHVWPIKDGKIQVNQRAYGHLSDVTALSFGACGNLLATASKDATLRVWDLDGPRPHQRLVLQGDLNPWGSDSNPWDSIALSPDGTKLAVASQKCGLTIWSISPSGLRILSTHKYGISAPPKERWGVPPPPPLLLAFTPDSTSLVFTDGTNPIKLIDLAKPSAIAGELNSGERVIYRDVAIPVPVAGQVALPAELEPLRIRDPMSVYALAVSLDGQTLAVAAPHEIEIWKRTEKGWSRRTGFWHLSHEVHSMAFERSGNTLLVGSRCGNGEIRRFDLSGEKPVQLNETVVHERPITSVSASPNGKFLAASDEGGRVVVWSAGMEKKLHEWTFPGPVHCVSFAPDGRHLALGNGDGTVYILRLAVPKDK